MTFLIGLLIIMPKLNKNIITRLYFINYYLPQSFINKTFRTPTISSMVFHTNILTEISSQHMAPSTFLITSL